MSDHPNHPARPDCLDCLVIGAGPAGLTAAIYLARFRRSVLVTDSGCSRARWIPVSHNTPGFRGGVGGEALLQELREQAGRFGIEPLACRVDRLDHDDGVFSAKIDDEVVRASSVILATGIDDVLPPIEQCEDAIRAGVVRLCAVCDGYETEERRVAVYGPAKEAFEHACYMRTFGRSVTMLASDGAVSGDTRDDAAAHGVSVVDDVAGLEWNGRDAIVVRRRAAGDCSFDAFYPVLGAHSRSALAVSLGAHCADERSLLVDAHQQTTVPGLYAAGDVVSALNQISVAYGHAAVAATAIHNALPNCPR
jgi:thioredoxin reductase (NADPH)